AFLLMSLAGDYQIVWAPATTFGKNVMPRAAALCDVQQISDITAVLDHQHFERPIYAGNAICTVKSDQPINFITVRTTGFEPCEAEGGAAVIETMAADQAAGLSRFLDKVGVIFPF
ncbi:MAG: electron transfer flavoprotein subunit alpha/FixB family protein, partial [Chlamydiota bacterium]